MQMTDAEEPANNKYTPALNLIRCAQVPRSSITDTVRSGNVIQEKRQWQQRVSLERPFAA
jgi:hypothetical protein